MNEVVRYTIGAGSPPTREPGPDLSAPIPPDAARSGSSLSKMNYGPRWAATNCQNKKCREGEPLLSHNYRSRYLSARTADSIKSKVGEAIADLAHCPITLPLLVTSYDS